MRQSARDDGEPCRVVVVGADSEDRRLLRTSESAYHIDTHAAVAELTQMDTGVHGYGR